MARFARLAAFVDGLPVGDGTGDQDEVLLELLDHCIAEMRAEGGSIMVFGDTRALVVRVVRRPADEDGTLSPVPAGQSVAGRVAETAEGMLLRGVPEAIPDLIPKRRPPASSVSVPIRLSGRALGVLNFNLWTAARQFTDIDLYVARLLGNQTAWAMMLAGRVAGLQMIASTDMLTGLYTRRHLEMRLGEEIQRAARRDFPICLVMIDLDEFKQINTMYGHLFADQVLRDFGALMRRSVRGVDIAARFGGDEFVVVLPETTIDTAVVIVRRLQEAVLAHRFVGLHGEPIALSLSAGIAQYPLDGRDADDLLHRADLALLDAKARGANTLSLGADV